MPNPARVQTLGEEWANSLTHGVGLLLLIIAAASYHPRDANAAHAVGRVGMLVYLASMTLLYAVSAAYHGAPAGRGKRFLMKLDYCAIYLFIAGTYTPFATGILAGHGGTALLWTIWTLAALGVVLQLGGKLQHPLLSTGVYLAMGWVVVAVARPMFELMPLVGLLWLVAGGVCYTAGVLFFLYDSRWKYSHSIWHLFVLAGSGCHFIAIRCYA